MSKHPNVQVKTEVYNQSQNKEDFITLNIYNPPKPINEDSIMDNNLTEANLNVGDNYANHKKEDSIDDFRKKAMNLDNTRQNPYPFSENKGVNQPPPPTINKDNYNYSKSVNPYFQDNINNNKYNLNNAPISAENDNKKVNNNVQIIKNPNYIENQMPKKEEKKKCPCSTCEICIIVFLLCLFWPLGVIYAYILCQRKHKKNENK